MDIGTHEVQILITAGKYKDVRRLLPILADWLNSAPYILAHLPSGTYENRKNISSPSKDLPSFIELLSHFPPNVRLLACKQSLDGTALILRLQESCGISQQCSINVYPFKVLLELSLKPLEIKTIRLVFFLKFFMPLNNPPLKY